MGVNIDELIVANPVSTEEAFKILEEMLKTNSFDVVVFDSIAALASESELSGEIGQATVALNARLISSVLRRITTLISSSNTCVIFINQYLDYEEGYGYHIKVTDDKPCTFLDENNRCTINSAKPNQCATFPYWKEYMDKNGNLIAGKFNRACPGVKIKK